MNKLENEGKMLPLRKVENREKRMKGIEMEDGVRG